MRSSRDAINSFMTQVVTPVKCYQQAFIDLPDVERALYDLGRLEPTDQHDPIKKPNQVADPKGEIARIKSDLRAMLKRLDEAEPLIAANRAAVKKLLD